MQTKQKSQLLDALKGVAILIVVFGHALQGAQHGGANLPLHKFIQCFQMEFFFVLSGFAAAYSFGKPIWEGAKRRLVRLGVPYLAWVAIFYLAEAILGIKQWTISDGLGCFVISGFWFLRHLLLISLAFLPIALRLGKIPVGILLSTALLALAAQIPGQDKFL